MHVMFSFPKTQPPAYASVSINFNFTKTSLNTYMSEYVHCAIVKNVADMLVKMSILFIILHFSLFETL